MNPTVSVIIPTYNRARLLKRAVGSILSQTYRDFEIVIIDDASIDNTREIVLEDFGGEIKKDRLVYVRNEEHAERSHSRNTGVRLAKGNYIALVDDDDILLPECLEKLSGYLDENKDIACVFSNFIMMYDSGTEEIRIQDLGRYSRYSLQELCLLGILGATCGSLYRKEIHQSVGGFKEDLNRGENKEFFNRVALNARIGYLDEITSIQYIHRGSFSGVTPKEYAYNREYLWEKVEEKSIRSGFKLRKEVRIQAYLDIGWLFLPDIKTSRKYLFKAIKINPLLFLSLDVWPLLVRLALSQSLYLKIKGLKKRKK
jgi:glycosyltransferase involved in cell wall biosynthesis